ALSDPRWPTGDYGLQIRFIDDFKGPARTRRPPPAVDTSHPGYGVQISIQGIQGQPFVVLNSQDSGTPLIPPSNSLMAPGEEGDGPGLSYNGGLKVGSGSLSHCQTSSNGLQGPRSRRDGDVQSRGTTSLMNYQKQPWILQPYDPDKSVFSPFIETDVHGIGFTPEERFRSKSLERSSAQRAAQQEQQSVFQSSQQTSTRFLASAAPSLALTQADRDDQSTLVRRPLYGRDNSISSSSSGSLSSPTVSSSTSRLHSLSLKKDQGVLEKRSGILTTPDLLRDQVDAATPATEDTARQILYSVLREGNNDSEEITRRKVNLVFEKIQTLSSKRNKSVAVQTEQVTGLTCISNFFCFLNASADCRWRHYVF
uniref:Uncharacterized protein n=1 Tax=Eptatretus burgeri TaxID=7764 RepID=A0A8C4Q3B1_EPTBU